MLQFQTNEQQSITLSSQDIAELYQQYYKILRAKIYRIVHNFEEAEELTQEVFVSILKNPVLKNTKNMSGWINLIATNTAINLIRKREGRKKHPTYSLSLFEQEESKENTLLSDSSDDPQEQDHNIFLIKEGLEKICPRHKRIYLLYIDGYTVEEIAAMEQVNHWTIRYILREAKRMLKTYCMALAG